MTLFYISFADDHGFRGATVVHADTADEAFQVATAQGLNPGGEAAIVMVPADAEDCEDIVPLINRLAGADELLGRGGKRQKDMSDAELANVRSHGISVVCDDCNN